METSYVFGIKQDESEPLKEYLDRFDKAVVQIKSCSDDTLIQAFREGVKDMRLVWTLAYDVPPTFAHLRGIAWKHAEADEYVRGRDARRVEAPSGPRTPMARFHQYTPLVATVEHVLNQVSGRGLLRDPPPLRTDRARRNQNKYCNFHKDVGHETKDCLQLRDQIELLVQDGHLREFVEMIITPTSTANRTVPTTHPNPGPSNRPNDSGLEHIVHTIFGGDATGATASSRRSYNNETDALAQLASGNVMDGLVLFLIQRLDQPSIEREEQVYCSENAATWMDPITEYLTAARLLENREEARWIKNTSARSGPHAGHRPELDQTPHSSVPLTTEKGPNA
ncbi:hypothetical protein TIFTF001_042608 [Ficus carica]|uniref:Retrotransposon gag domain-containing protein n=1 Tax=Ficus carica TaxID=3494 RepID=A0AA87ZNP1_FICCA|nr:hypothetical protein TIFTF001_042608 [Ficus carica]